MYLVSPLIVLMWPFLTVLGLFIDRNTCIGLNYCNITLMETGCFKILNFLALFFKGTHAYVCIQLRNCFYKCKYVVLFLSFVREPLSLFAAVVNLRDKLPHPATLTGLPRSAHEEMFYDLATSFHSSVSPTLGALHLHC